MHILSGQSFLASISLAYSFAQKNEHNSSAFIKLHSARKDSRQAKFDVSRVLSATLELS